MPQFYGSQRLFWYLIVAVTLNSASIAVLTYFLVERAKAGSTAVWHFFAVFERCLPAWWKEKRLEAERESVAQLFPLPCEDPLRRRGAHRLKGPINK